MNIGQRIDALGAQMVAEVERTTMEDLAHIVATRSARVAASIMVNTRARIRGEHRRRADDRRLRDLLDAARINDPAAADMPVAPARGPMRKVAEYGVTPGGVRVETGAHWLRMDQLTLMCRQAAMRHERLGREGRFVAPFTPAQIAMGQRYSALIERHDAAGMKCASAEVRAVAVSGGGGGGGFIEAYLSEGREIRELHRRIGDGVALPVQRAGRRRAVTDRALVDAVCIAGKDLPTILRDYGWSKNGERLAALRAALAAILDRMQGYR